MPRPYAIGEDGLPMRPVEGGVGTFRVPIDRRVGARFLVQRILRLGSGRSGPFVNEDSEDVVYVAGGEGVATVGGRGFDLQIGTGLLVPPRTRYAYDSTGAGDLILISVLAPPPGGEGHPSHLAGEVDPERLTVREEDEEPLPAGEDRYFKLMIDPRLGCRFVTQFLGFIDRSRAPYHTHPYEEAICVLEGEGLLHLDGREVPIKSGSSIFLPPGTPHCLENQSEGVLKVLGVFAPAGSPAVKMEAYDPGS